MSELILTDEQKDIVKLDVLPGQLLKISALAGTGKTTTLRQFVAAHPDKKFLYLCYNTSVSAAAKDTFPSNAKCQTTHSLAFGKTGFPYKNKLGNLKPYLLTDHLGIEHYGVGKYLIDVLVKFLASADDEISEKHLILNQEKSEEEYVLEKDPKKIQFLLKKANQLWEKMQDVENKKIPMLHDGYLKLFQLSKPQLNYDYVLLDEAHDTNGVTLDLFLNQHQAAKIIVGDEHQSCYAFRHAYNAMSQVEGDVHKYLSHSFRFGNEIAGIANLVLNKVKKEKRTLIGRGQIGKIGWIDTNQPYTIVARTNGALFDEAASLLQSRQSFGWIGTSSKDKFSPFNHYYFNRVLDVYYLWAKRNNAIKDKYIKKFKNFNHFVEVIKDKDAPDLELQARASVVEKYKEQIPTLIDSIVFNSIDPNKAHICFTTAHRSKGLEWDQVRLTHDFQEVIEEKEKKKRIFSLEEMDEQEVNLLYIAATRAKKTLQMNKSILNLVKYNDES